MELVDIRAVRLRPVGSRERQRVGQGALRWLLSWGAILLVSFMQAQAMLAEAASAVVAPDGAREADSTQRISEGCAAGGVSLLYVGLNSWIPAQACLGPAEEARDELCPCVTR